MTELKCPFCGEDLDASDPQCVDCKNDYCHPSFLKYGSKELWQALIDTKKKLDIAVDALKKANDDIRIDCDIQARICIDKALAKINAKEEK